MCKFYFSECKSYKRKKYKHLNGKNLKFTLSVFLFNTAQKQNICITNILRKPKVIIPITLLFVKQSFIILFFGKQFGEKYFETGEMIKKIAFIMCKKCYPNS